MNPGMNRLSDEPFPPYAFVPGGPWPHPRGSAAGPLPTPVVEGAWARSDTYLRGIALFNAGYYWEAHEVWEGLWHAHGRRGPTADLLKALIKLAAAGVKVRERMSAGAATHARRAAELFASVRDRAGARWLGLDLDHWIKLSRTIAENPPEDPEPPGARVSRVFDFWIEPTS
jgi:hypothetical protein